MARWMSRNRSSGLSLSGFRPVKDILVLYLSLTMMLTDLVTAGLPGTDGAFDNGDSVAINTTSATSSLGNVISTTVRPIPVDANATIKASVIPSEYNVSIAASMPSEAMRTVSASVASDPSTVAASVISSEAIIVITKPMPIPTDAMSTVAASIIILSESLSTVSASIIPSEAMSTVAASVIPSEALGTAAASFIPSETMSTVTVAASIVPSEALSTVAASFNSSEALSTMAASFVPFDNLTSTISSNPPNPSSTESNVPNIPISSTSSVSSETAISTIKKPQTEFPTFPTTTIAIKVPTSFPSQIAASPTSFPTFYSMLSEDTPPSRVPTGFTTLPGNPSPSEIFTAMSEQMTQSPSAHFQFSIKTEGPTQAISSIPAEITDILHVQLMTKRDSPESVTLANGLDDGGNLKVNFMRYPSLTNQVAKLCGVSEDHYRILDVLLCEPWNRNNDSGSMKEFDPLRFSIKPGDPSNREILDVIRNGLTSNDVQMNVVETVTTLSLGLPLYSWTDSGPCPVSACQNKGRCEVSLSGKYVCACNGNFTGSSCEFEQYKPVLTPSPVVDGDQSRPLLGLLVIPIVIALIIIALLIVYFCVWRRRQQLYKIAKPDVELSTYQSGYQLDAVSDPGVKNLAYQSEIVKHNEMEFDLNTSADTDSYTDQKSSPQLLF